jgi:hypothetical protein
MFFVTVQKVLEALPNCKEGFARKQLNQMVTEGLLVATDSKGIRFYCLGRPLSPIRSPEDIEVIRQRVRRKTQKMLDELVEIILSELA